MSTAIPYTVEARPDTGLNNVKIGMWLFLASEVMLFGALFAGYILLRVGNPEWGHGASELSVPMAFVNTLVLITPSVTMVTDEAMSTRVLVKASGTLRPKSVPAGQLVDPTRRMM